MSVLEAEGLVKQFGGVCAVNGLSFTLDEGEMLALIGPNGAGKSTTFALLGGQLRPDRGAVRLEGADVTAAPPRRLARLGLARTFQIAAVFPSLTVRENVLVALNAHHRQSWHWWRPAERGFRRSSAALLARVGLEPLADRAAATLAYADLKRLELALVLAQQPRVLLMDEPTAGMAETESAALMALVRGLARGFGLAVLFTEHDSELVFGTADRILVLDRGTLIAAGTAAVVRNDARVRAAYLGAAEPPENG